MGESVQLELRGEIVSAVDFEEQSSSSIFLSFCVLLPAGWVCEDDDQLSGVTHCTTTSAQPVVGGDKIVDVAHFNHLFTLSVKAPSTNAGGCPQLVVEVCTMDSWQRVCTEGYGLAALPVSPGRSQLSIPTWRPLPDLSCSHAARVAEMRRFFIGGSPQLKDMGCHLAATQPGNVLSHAGLRAASSGQVHVTLDCCLQNPRGHSAPILKAQRESRVLVSSVDQVIAAYNKVQARMSRVRHAMRMELQVAKSN